MSRHPLRRFRGAFPTIRFMLVIGGAVLFFVAALRSDHDEDILMNMGWFLLCCTALFLDPENPPGGHQEPTADDPEEDE